MDSWWFANLTTAWFILAPLVPLIAAYAPRRLLRSYFKSLLDLICPDLTVEIARRDYEDYSVKASNDYAEVKAYLSAACSREAKMVQGNTAVQGEPMQFSLGLGLGQEIEDRFRGAALTWSSVESVGEGNRFPRRCYRLTFHRRHRQLVVDEYLPHVLAKGRDALFSNRSRRLYSNNIISEYSYWDRVWDHIHVKFPTTFDTLAMDPAKKKEIMDDLDAFRNGKGYYASVGKAWKRGYLLYGPPGTGKSSMIAAMANYLDYDVYDVELTVVRHNHDLRKLLAETTDKSITVIEDIDCSLDLTGERRAKRSRTSSTTSSDSNNGRRDSDDSDKPSKVTLSGLLNFIDGIWSACGGKRIVVFTTNHVGKLDPALIRRGRMDMHIEMSYCGFEAFRVLARNYLGVESHPLFGAVGELLREANVTPADVAECLMTSTREGRGVDSSLEHLIEEVKKSKDKAEADTEAAAAAKEAYRLGGEKD